MLKVHIGFGSNVLVILKVEVLWALENVQVLAGLAF